MSLNRPFRVCTLVPLYFFEPARLLRGDHAERVRVVADELNETLLLSRGGFDVEAVKNIRDGFQRTCEGGGMQRDDLQVRQHYHAVSRDQETPGVLVIHLRTDSEAFECNREAEVGFILKQWVISSVMPSLPVIAPNDTANLWSGLRDSNGESVGYVHYAPHRRASPETLGSSMRLSLDVEAMYGHARETFGFQGACDALKVQVAEVLNSQAERLITARDTHSVSNWLSIDDVPPIALEASVAPEALPDTLRPN